MALTRGDLTPKQHKALAALLTEPTLSDAAAKVGIGERTLHSWLAEPAFKAAYLDVRREAVGQAIARLQQLSSGAVAVLAQVAADRQAPASSPVTAAIKIIEVALQGVQLQDMEARI